SFCFFFFFQAEDGIRDFHVTGVQTCALPISIGTIVLPFITSVFLRTDLPSLWALQGLFLVAVPVVCSTRRRIERFYTVNATLLEIGRASCRERVWTSVVDGSLRKETRDSSN